MRIVKEHEKRKAEIIAAGSRLFEEKGYEQCSVNDILAAVGIAKGTFYYYFKSKEEVLDAVVRQTGELLASRAAEAAKADLPPAERLLGVFMSLRVDENTHAGLMAGLHRPENTLLHQRSLAATVDGITPVLAQIVSEGAAQGDFSCAYPEQYMRVFLLSALSLLDDGIFELSAEEKQTQFAALISLLELMLGAVPGSLLGMAAEQLFLRAETNNYLRQ